MRGNSLLQKSAHAPTQQKTSGSLDRQISYQIGIGEYYPDELEDGRLTSQSQGSSHKGGRRMGKVIITVVSLICGFAALGGIKMMDLPGLITALLVIIDIGFIMLIIIYASGIKKTDAGK
jgi:hypothetical protein